MAPNMTPEQVAKVNERLLVSFERLCHNASDCVVKCHVLLCARALGMTARLFSRMADEVERAPLSPEAEESNLVAAFMRQLTLLHYERAAAERREFLARWLPSGNTRRHDPVTLCWLMGLAAEQHGLIPEGYQAYAADWFLTHDELKSVRARAWVPHYLELWGHEEAAARMARLVFADREANGSWPQGPPVTAGVGYALSLARCIARDELMPTVYYLVRRLSRGVDVADASYPLNALKFLFANGVVPSGEVDKVSRRLQASVFLSHASKDKDVARRLASDLRAHGVRVWIDEAEIRPGDSIIGKLESGLADSSYLFLLASDASLRSRWVMEELRAALHDSVTEGHIRVVPIRLDTTPLPFFLRDKKHVSLHDYGRSLQELLGLFD